MRQLLVHPARQRQQKPVARRHFGLPRQMPNRLPPCDTETRSRAVSGEIHEIAAEPAQMPVSALLIALLIVHLCFLLLLFAGGSSTSGEIRCGD
jgi:hypothetical protein